MSGATSSSGNGAAGPAGGGGPPPNPAGIRPAEPAERPEGLTIEGGLEEIRRSRARAATGGRPDAGRERHGADAGREAAAEPGAEDGQPAGDDAAQAPEAAEGAAGNGEGEGGEPRFRVEGMGEVGIGELVQGYLRQADYTAKTQAAAQQQQQLQQAHQAFTEMRTQLEARLGQVTRDMGAEFEQPIDWVKLAREDPLGYQEKHARFTAYQQAAREREALAAQAAREEHAHKARILQQANEFLGRTLPSWKEPTKRAELLGEIREYALWRGYSEQELDTREVLDPRQILVLHDGAQWRKVAGRKFTPQPNGGGGQAPRGTPPAPQPNRRESELRRNFERDPTDLRNAGALVSAIRHRPPGRR